MLGTNLADKNLLITSRPPERITYPEWKYNNRAKSQISDNQKELADRVLAESERLIEETRDVTDKWKREVDHRLKERVDEIKFLIDELKKERTVACLEEEALKTYRQRLLNAINALKEKSIVICEKCIILRENRVGVDMVDDEVDRQLRHELKVIRGAQELLQKTLEETNEQIRRLRKTIYLLDRDLSNKDKSLQIDETNLILKENQLEMAVYEGNKSLDQSASTLEEWKTQTHINIENTAKELNCATQLRSYVDILLKQVVEDLRNQTDRTNEAFERRINETRQTKQNLEVAHNDTANKVNEITRNITNLEKELAEKEGYVALSHMRQANRCYRPGIELVADDVQASLRNEAHALNHTIQKLIKMISESKATLRYLLHSQMLQEEEINVKANSLKIDEVDCMTLRQALDYQSF